MNFDLGPGPAPLTPGNRTAGRAGRLGSRAGLFLFRPSFLFFCLYAMIYVMLRTNGQIVSQDVPAFRGTTTSTEHVVGPEPTLPRYRRQIYRAFFSPLMVAEEEGRWLGSRGSSLARKVGEAGRSLLPD